jgi:hypothetical protein
VVKEKAPKEEWIVEPIGWKPATTRRADGLTEKWGRPTYKVGGKIDIPVILIDGDITVDGYTMELVDTVKSQVAACAKQACLDIIQGRNPWVPLDVQRARKLLSHHEGEKAWEQLRTTVNELYAELNEVADATTATVAALTNQITELQNQLNEARREEIRMEEEATSTITEMQKHLRDARGGWLRRQNNVQA